MATEIGKRSQAEACCWTVDMAVENLLELTCLSNDSVQVICAKECDSFVANPLLRSACCITCQVFTYILHDPMGLVNANITAVTGRLLNVPHFAWASQAPNLHLLS